jgi:antitoxin ParD1/3/4
MRSRKPITLTLGTQQETLDDLVNSGEYASESEAVSAALRALERERESLEPSWRDKVREALDDPRPRVPAKKVFDDLRAFHDEK